MQAERLPPGQPDGDGDGDGGEGPPEKVEPISPEPLKS
jgi:hypothetical protein